jgi:hypothetical protein
MVEVELPELVAGEWTVRVQPDDATTPDDAGVVIRVER